MRHLTFSVAQPLPPFLLPLTLFVSLLIRSASSWCKLKIRGLMTNSRAAKRVCFGGRCLVGCRAVCVHNSNMMFGVPLFRQPTRSHSHHQTSEIDEKLNQMRQLQSTMQGFSAHSRYAARSVPYFSGARVCVFLLSLVGSSPARKCTVRAHNVMAFANAKPTMQ